MSFAHFRPLVALPLLCDILVELAHGSRTPPHHHLSLSLTHTHTHTHTSQISSCANDGTLTGLQFLLAGFFQQKITGGVDRRLTFAEEVGAAMASGFISGVPCCALELTMIQQQVRVFFCLFVCGIFWFSRREGRGEGGVQSSSSSRRIDIFSRTHTLPLPFSSLRSATAGQPSQRRCGSSKRTVIRWE